MEEDQDLHLYYSLMEFRHNLMLEYLEPLEKMRIEEQPRLSDLLLEIDKKQARLTGLLEYYFNFFRGMYEIWTSGNICRLLNFSKRPKAS